MQMFSILVFVLISYLPTVSFAHQEGQSLVPCEQYLGAKKALTLEMAREMSVEWVKRNLPHSPVPGFDNIEKQIKVSPVGEAGPLALQQVFGLDKFFVASPAPTAKDAITVSLIEPAKHGFPVHVDVQWAGQRTSTTVYTSVPWHLGSQSSPEILKRADLPLAVLHLHGGGTPTAGGVNFDKVAENLLRYNIPTLAPDMPGHGRGPSQVEGFLSAKEQLDWVLEVADKMLHPNTKIVLSGHSWGAMFGVYLQRLKRQDPQYARIVHILAMAPGIDPTLGGSVEDRNKFEQWYQDNFRGFKSRIAEADFEFQENVLANGKDSDKGAWFTGFFNLDYSLPPLKPEDYADLTPMTVIVGTADGVVYVGFEEQFEKLFAGLGERFIRLGSGPTFHNKDKSKLRPTGHQIFDREIMPGEEGYVEGKDTYQVYRFIGNLALAQTNGASLPEPASSISSPSQVIDAVTRNYANFFGFRAYMANAVEFVDRETEWTIPMANEKRHLDTYLGKVAERRAKGVKEAEAKVAEAVHELRKRLGAHEKLTLEFATEELATPPMTPQREKDLTEYVAAIKAIDELLATGFKDPEADRELEKLRKDNAALLAKAGVDLPEIKSVVDRMNLEAREANAKKNEAKALAKSRGETYQEDPTLKKAEREQETVRSQLAQLHQLYTGIYNKKQAKFGEERKRRVALLTAPQGIREPRMATRELKADRSPERRRLVEAFVAEYPAVEAAARAVARAELENALASIPRPDGVASEADALARQTEINARKELTYVSTKAPASAALVAKIVSLQGDLEKVVRGGGQGDMAISLKQLEDLVFARERKVSEIAKTLDDQWAARRASSPELAKLQEEYESALDNYKTHYPLYENAKSAFLAELDRQGRRTAENVLRQTPELLELRANSQAAKKAFLAVKAKRDESRLTPEFRAALGELTEAERRLEARRRSVSMIRQDLELTRQLYVKAMQAAGEPVPLTVESYPVFALWNRSLDEVRSHLENDRFFMQAMTQNLARWDGFMAELRRKHNLLPKDESGY